MQVDKFGVNIKNWAWVADMTLEIIRIYHEGGIEKSDHADRRLFLEAKSVPRITDWHHEGRIFLSHPHMNNGFKVPNLILEKREKGFKINLSSLRCDMVKSI